MTAGRCGFRAPRRFCCSVTDQVGVVEKVRGDAERGEKVVEARREGPATALRKSDETMFHVIANRA